MLALASIFLIKYLLHCQGSITKEVFSMGKWEEKSTCCMKESLRTVSLLCNSCPLNTPSFSIAVGLWASQAAIVIARETGWVLLRSLSFLFIYFLLLCQSYGISNVHLALYFLLHTN